MSKTAYTDEEVRKVLLALLFEKKKVKALEAQLDKTGKERVMLQTTLDAACKASEAAARTSTEEIIKLKRLVIAFKKKYEQEGALSKTGKEARDPEVLAANEQINKELEAVKIAYEETLKVNQRQKQSLERLAGLIHEKDRRIAELQRFEYGLRKSTENKNELEEAVEKERQHVKLLETDKENLHRTISENRQHVEQLERVIQFLRERSEEAHLEANQLREDFQTAQDNIAGLNQKLRELQEKYDQTNLRLSAESEEKNEAQEELRILHHQFEVLRARALESERQLEERRADLAKAGETIQSLENETGRMNNLLLQKSAAYEGLEREVGLIKQNLVRGLREAKEIETRYLESVNEKVAAITKIQQLQQHVDKQKEEAALLKNRINQAEVQESVLRQGFESQLMKAEEDHQAAMKSLESEHEAAVGKLEEQIEGLRSELDQALQIEKEKEDLERKITKLHEQLNHSKDQIGLCEEDKRKLQESLRVVQGQIDEKDSQLNTAQQHLAKKLRETSQLTDRIEEVKAQLHELQRNEAQLKEKNLELQAGLDAKLQQEKDLQDQMQEAHRQAEVQIKQYEEKYLRIYEKWQTDQARLQELEKLQEKYSQMQSLLSNLGSVLGSPMAAPQPQILQQHPWKEEKPRESPRPAPQNPPPAFGELPPRPEEPEGLEGPQQGARPYQNLFDMPRGSNRPRQNLFD